MGVSAVIYTHSHIDHFAGVRGIREGTDITPPASPNAKIYASEGFLEEAVSENVFAGNVMGRRASYMYGNLIPKNQRGQVDGGLGKTTSVGESTLIAPDIIIDDSTQELTVDGVKIEFQNVPGSEAPAEMMFFFPAFGALCASEDATHTLHNLYTLRGAKVRDAIAWANYLSEAIDRFGDRAEVVFASHHWPVWNDDKTETNEVVDYLKQQRDLYKYIHDQTLRLANEGYTMLEIADTLELPESLAKVWANRGYYGSLNHDIKAVYQRYLGWFDGNPAHLYTLPPEEAGAKYIEYMEQPGDVISKARTDYNQGNYRWVAQVMSDFVYGKCEDNLPPYNQPLQPSDQNCFDATRLEADALEQLGYQAESGPWRNFFLTGAQELREGVVQAGAPAAASPDIVRAMTPDLLFDYLAIRLNGPVAADRSYVFVITLTYDDKPDETFVLNVENGVLTYKELAAGGTVASYNTKIEIKRSDLDALILGEKTLNDIPPPVVDGNAADFEDFLSLLDRFDFWFNIVLP